MIFYEVTINKRTEDYFMTKADAVAAAKILNRDDARSGNPSKIVLVHLVDIGAVNKKVVRNILAGVDCAKRRVQIWPWEEE